MLRVVPVNPADPPEGRLAAALDILESGGIVALPTETFYGLSVDPFNETALAELNQIKGKGHDDPVLLLMADASQVEQVAEEIPDLFNPLVEMFWPGPLTLVIRAAARLPFQISGDRGTVGVRVPGLALPRRLAARLGRPISGVSANLHGNPPCRTAAEVAQVFREGVGMILDGGPAPGGAPSTILDLSGPRPRILREGQVPSFSLRPFVPDLELSV